MKMQKQFSWSFLLHPFKRWVPWALGDLKNLRVTNFVVASFHFNDGGCLRGHITLQENFTGYKHYFARSAPFIERKEKHWSATHLPRNTCTESRIRPTAQTAFNNIKVQIHVYLNLHVQYLTLKEFNSGQTEPFLGRRMFGVPTHIFHMSETRSPLSRSSGTIASWDHRHQANTAFLCDLPFWC